ncbi:hypothetical protein Q8F55_008096 [Vanrija albida]|uniref:Uncharacterized protein n=1 Tax=Vanrija albida TaxID=181172 RepID=A0ABR3PVM1_9TREE
MPRLFLDTRLSPIVSSVSPKTSPLLSPEVATPRPLPETPRTPAVRAVPPDAPNPFLSSPVAVAFAAPAPAPAAAPRRSSTLPVPPLSAPAEPDPHVLHAWRDWSADLRVREQALRDREAQLTRREDALHQREIVAAVHAKGLQRLGMDVSAAATAATSRVVATPAEMSPAAPTPLRLARVPSSRGDAAARRDSASSAPMPARPRLYPDAVVPAAAAARRARTSPLPAGRATSPTPITTATPGATASESEALISTLLAEIDTLTQSLSVAQGEIAQREADYERLERRHADALGSYEGERARWAELDGQRDAVEDELKARIVVLEQMLGFERREERRGSGEHSHEPTRRPSADTGPSGDTGPHETTGYHLEPAAQEQRTVGNWVLDVREYAGAKGKGKLREGSASTDDAAVAAVVRRDSFGVGDDEAGPSGGGEHRGAAARGAAEREWEREEAEREAALKRARTGQQPQQRRQSQLLHRSSTPVSDLLLSPQLVSPHDVQVEWVGVDEPKGRGATGAVARLAL